MKNAFINSVQKQQNNNGWASSWGQGDSLASLIKSTAWNLLLQTSQESFVPSQPPCKEGWGPRTHPMTRGVLGQFFPLALPRGNSPSILHR